jgi:hypothetical protein
MVAQSPTDVISRTLHAIGTKKTMVTISFTGRKLTALGILPKGANSTSFILLITFFQI